MKEVILLGHGPTRLQCPFDVETWSVNTSDLETYPRMDKVFVVDRITDKEFDFAGLAKLPCIVSSIPYPEHPEWKVELYPIKEILNHFKTSFFSNAICYMIAYALYKGYSKIRFYGVDMMNSTSYLFEKGGVEYWMGIAHASGVPIINTKESATGKTIDGRMYGYWGPGFDNLKSFSKAVAEESQRLIKNITGAVDVSIDPDGHLARKNAEVREYIKDTADTQRRELVSALGARDESEEWKKNSDGSWIRKEVRIVE